MDGAPYLRKVDLKMYRSYPELSMALEKMFSSFTSGKCVVAALTTMRSIQITGVDMSSSSCLSGNHNVYERDSAHASLQSSAPHMGCDGGGCHLRLRAVDGEHAQCDDLIKAWRVFPNLGNHFNISGGGMNEWVNEKEVCHLHVVLWRNSSNA
ncbi:hypothetical protein BHE74_00016521 [Ensete ventricosum]|nr:hypothetical protein BHE74_00016521 [Ensete ventricosum]RZR88777.1 hypothetical protein BHM03_00016408 [Ensete ventricosum]